MEYLKTFVMYIKEGCGSSSAVATTTSMFRRTGGASGPEKVLGLQAMCRLRELYQATRWNSGQKEMSGSPVVDTVHWHR